MFEIIGLGRFDELVYDLVVRHRGRSLAQLTETTGTRPDKIIASCSRLVEYGLLHSKDGVWFRPSPTAPDTIVEQLECDIDAEHAEKRKQASRLRAQLIRMLDQNLLDGPPAGAPVTALPTVEVMQMQLLRLVGLSRHEVLRIWTGPTTRPQAVPPPTQLAAPETKALRRDVQVRILCPSAAVLRSAGVELRPACGVAIRTVPSPPANLHVFDRRTAVVEVPHGGGAYAALMVRGDPLVHIIHALFETWWSAGQEAVAPNGRPPLDEQEYALLRLLGEGAKDDSIARQLGVSVRTVRRRISDLLARLDATSRFQAGALAARRGWL